MRRATVVATLLLGSLWVPLGAPLRGDDGARRERTVIPGGPGGNRLDLDIALLAGAAPLDYGVDAEDETPRLGAFRGGLTDLRLVDAAGREVPYLLVGPPSGVPEWRDGRVVAAGAQAFEVDLGALVASDRLRLEGLAAPFLERFRLEASGDRSHWIELVAEGTLFDLPEEHLARTEVAFEPTELRYLRLTWGGRRRATAFAPSAAAARLVGAVAAAPALRLTVAAERLESEPGVTRWRLPLPAPHLPMVAVELATDAEHVFRVATVSEARLGRGELVPVELGRATLRRATRPEGVAADLRIPLAPPSEPELELAVEDGDNPPLALTGASVELAPLPWIYFESTDGAPLVARYGDASLQAPRYDLEAVRGQLGGRPLARARWQGAEQPAAPAAAAAGTTAVALPALAAPLTGDHSTWRRAVPPAPAGTLLALPIDAAVLAHARHDLGDLRLVALGGDAAEPRQVPYLLEQRSAPLGLDVALPAPAPAAGDPPTESRYRLTLPYATLPAGRLVLRTSARVFEREVRLEVRAGSRSERQSQPRVLAADSWRHADASRSAPVLSLDLPREIGCDLDLVIEEGDNAPLPLESARLQLPARRLRFVHPGGAVELRYGDIGRVAPRYDLALLAPRLLGAPARESELAAEIESSAPPRGQAARWAFWGGLALAVVGLLALLARLLRT